VEAFLFLILIQHYLKLNIFITCVCFQDKSRKWYKSNESELSIRDELEENMRIFDETFIQDFILK
jgi:hypothetical protein